MNYDLNSLKGVIWGIIYGTTIEVIRGDTRSLDYSPYEQPMETGLETWCIYSYRDDGQYHGQPQTL